MYARDFANEDLVPVVVFARGTVQLAALASRTLLYCRNMREERRYVTTTMAMIRRRLGVSGYDHALLYTSIVSNIISQVRVFSSSFPALL